MDDSENPSPVIPIGTDPRSIPGWLLRGAIREDDTPFSGNPHDGLTPGLVRVVNHFYDPVNDRGVEYLAVRGEKATDWASGATNAFASPNTPDTARENHYTLFDAREYMWRALTGRDKSGSSAIGPGGTASNEAVRKAYWATTFRALGDVLHLVQDLAQPQHTRNDVHIVDGWPGREVYEAYTEARAKGERFRCFGGAQVTVALDYGSYPKVSMRRYGDYFSSERAANPGGPIEVRNGRGIAEYSNRNFFTAATNLDGDTNPYLYPSKDPASYTAQPVALDDPCVPLNSSFTPRELYMGAVTDTLNPGYVDRDAWGTAYVAGSVPLTTRGLWQLPADTGEEPYIIKDGYALTEPVYRAMGDHMIPRAVAYSAGVIDYFFRGRLEVLAPSEGVYGVVDHGVVHTVSGGVPFRQDGRVFGFDRLKLRLRNATPSVVDGQSDYPQGMTGGTLVAVARFRRNPCYRPDLSGEINGQGQVPSGCSLQSIPTSELEHVVSKSMTVTEIGSTTPLTLTFDFSDNPIPINAVDLYLQVVYRGRLGEEDDAVVAAMLDLNEPAYYSIGNFTDYVTVEGAYYTQAQIVSGPESASLQAIIDGYGNRDGEFNEDIGPLTLTDERVYVGAASTPLVQIDALPVRRYVRFAVLAAQDPLTIRFVGTRSAHVLEFGPVINQFATPDNYVYSPIGKVRNFHYRYLDVPMIEYGAPGSEDYSVMSDLAETDPYPVTVNFP